MQNRSYNLNLLDYLIYLFMLFYLAVDSMAGILISRGVPNIGALYKIFLIFLMALSVCCKSKKAPIIISFLTAYLFLLSIRWVLNPVFADFQQSFQTLFKIFCVIIAYIYFINSYNKQYIINIIKSNYFVFFVNILAGILGFAYGTYQYDGQSVGSKGFFYAGNEVTYTFICLVFLTIYYKVYPNIILYGLNIVISFLIGTKAGILASILLVCGAIYYNSSKMKQKYILFSFVIMIFISFELVTVFLKDTLLMKLIFYKFGQHQTGSLPILNALLSGRLNFLSQVEFVFFKDFSLYYFLFGMGFPRSISRIEMDFFEVFYYYGLSTLFIITSFYILLLRKTTIKRYRYLRFFNIICISISFLAGHVLYSLMGGMFFAIANGRINFKKK